MRETQDVRRRARLGQCVEHAAEPEGLVVGVCDDRQYAARAEQRVGAGRPGHGPLVPPYRDPRPMTRRLLRISVEMRGKELDHDRSGLT